MNLMQQFIEFLGESGINIDDEENQNHCSEAIDQFIGWVNKKCPGKEVHLVWIDSADDCYIYTREGYYYKFHAVATIDDMVYDIYRPNKIMTLEHYLDDVFEPGIELQLMTDGDENMTYYTPGEKN